MAIEEPPSLLIFAKCAHFTVVLSSHLLIHLLHLVIILDCELSGAGTVFVLLVCIVLSCWCLAGASRHCIRNNKSRMARYLENIQDETVNTISILFKILWSPCVGSSFLASTKQSDKGTCKTACYYSMIFRELILHYLLSPTAKHLWEQTQWSQRGWQTRFGSYYATHPPQWFTKI